jgi:hypothetical protein
MEKHDEELSQARAELAKVSLQRDKLAENLRTALATIQQLRSEAAAPAALASDDPVQEGTPSSSSSVRISSDLATDLALAADGDAAFDAENLPDAGSGVPKPTEEDEPSTPPSESPKTDTDAEEVPSSPSGPDDDDEGKDAPTDDGPGEAEAEGEAP